MLKKLYDKSEIWFAVTWIIIYCVFMSIGDSLSNILGIEKIITLPIGITLSVIILFFLKKNQLLEPYGFCPSKTTSKSMLFYIPVFVMLTANFWCGLAFNYDAFETILYILTMLCVGFLEEIIFRGLLFEAMRKDNTKIAIIVSSITFGLGHILNLINGSGTELLPNLLQVIYATSAGFMFVMIYYKTKSLYVCIIAHGIFNALSVFSNEINTTLKMQIISAIILSVITASYAIFIAISIKENISQTKTITEGKK